jgi:hypothetical protein
MIDVDVTHDHQPSPPGAIASLDETSSGIRAQ